MSDEKLFASTEEFVSAVKAKGIDKIIFAETNERRAVQTAPDKLDVVHVESAALLAYDGGVLYKCVAVAPNMNELYAQLAKDFDVTKRNRNIT